MTLRHPFEWLPASVRKRALLGVFVLMLLAGAGLQVIGQPLKTAGTPKGIVSFQLAGQLDVSNAIVESWGPAGRVNAGLNLGLDYLFLFAYGSFLSLACVLLASHFSERNPPVPLVDFLRMVGDWRRAFRCVGELRPNSNIVRNTT